MTTTLQDRLYDKYQTAKEKYETLKKLKPIAEFALSTIPDEFFEDSLKSNAAFLMYDNRLEFDVKFPFSKKIIRERYKMLRKVGWEKDSTYTWEQSLEITFKYPGTDITLEAQFMLDNVASTCVKLPTKVKKVKTERVQILDAEIICSDDQPELFSKDEDGNTVYIGETPEPEVVEEE